MKYGVIAHATTMNFGDDVQTYAAKKQLPKVDYYLTRESLDTFESENGEAVGVIMNAWWLWRKWHWPPAQSIYPLLISMHINNYNHWRKSSPIETQWLDSIGGDYFRAYGPVGSRDNTTIEFFEKNGIETYFSGCMTLTLPKQKSTPDAGSYVCLVDLKPELEKKARELLKDSGLEIRTFTHHCDYRNLDISMEERMNKVEEVLAQYQNAKFVITRRLHVALPCLALEAPVLTIVNLDDVGNYTRWAPYSDWVYCTSESDFLSGDFEYDFANPPLNKADYMDTRNALINRVKDFVEEISSNTLSADKLKKIKYTEDEERAWRYNLMQWTLDTWLHKSRGILDERNMYKKETATLKKKIQTLRNKNETLKKDIVNLNEEKRTLKKIIHELTGLSD